MSESAIKKQWQKMQYNDAISKAKTLVASIKVNQLKVAELAVHVCIKGKGIVDSDSYTYTKFANQIGIHPKTLLEWVASYEHGAKSINPESPTEVSYKDARAKLTSTRITKRMHPEIKPAIKAVQRNKTKNEEEKKIDSYSLIYLKYSVRMRGCLERQGSKNIEKGVKTELKIILNQIIKKL